LAPLPRDSKTIVDFRLSDDEAIIEEFAKDSHELLQALQLLRPEASGWIDAIIHYGNPHIFHPNPATKLAYAWLWSDLERIAWVEGLFSLYS
jgi:hypothetical protein